MSSLKSVEFFFDFSSPWTYMAYTQIEKLCLESDAALIWKPFYVAAVFRKVNHNIKDMRSNPIAHKLAYYQSDMQRWASRLGIKIARPPVYGGGSLPLNSAAALRGSFLAMDQGKISEYAGAVFRAYWENLEDVSDRAVLVRIAIEVGIDPVRFASQLEAPETRERLAENTNEIMQRGGFGTPTFFVNGSEMYFGNDRLDFLKEALKA